MALIPFKEVPACSVDDCEKAAVGRGLCVMHHRRVLRTGGVVRQCVTEGCNEDLVGPRRLRCQAHAAESLKNKRLGYSRVAHGRTVRLLNLPKTKKRHGAPIGSTRFDGDGYVAVKMADNKWRRQHRVVMEGLLGRALLREEQVHHINGDRRDNDPQNLELWTNSQPSGQRVEDKLAWAREFIALYEGTLYRSL